MLGSAVVPWLGDLGGFQHTFAQNGVRPYGAAQYTRSSMYTAGVPPSTLSRALGLGYSLTLRSVGFSTRVVAQRKSIGQRVEVSEERFGKLQELDAETKHTRSKAKLS
jgi:hypothetical protein